MTDDEIDAAILEVIPAERYAPNNESRTAFLIGYAAGIEAAAGLLPIIRDLPQHWNRL